MTITYPQAPTSNLGNLYVNNMRLSWVATTQLAVAQGQARDSSNTVDIVLALPPLNNGTLQTQPFTITNTVQGAGGLDSGTIAPWTSYAVYVIYSSAYSQIRMPPSPEVYLKSPPYTPPPASSPVIQSENYKQANVLISLSFTGPVLPAGYDCFRRIGAVSTIANSTFEPFVQTGNGVDRAIWFTGAIETYVLSGSTVYVPIPVAPFNTLYPYIPITAATIQIRNSITYAAAAGDDIELLPFGPLANAYAGAVAQIMGNVDATSTNLIPVGFNNGVPEIDFVTTSGSDTVQFGIQAYTDSL